MKGEGPGIQLIVLVGLMAAGKSTVGKLLAEKVGWRFIDLDEEIVREAGTSIAEIFRTAGEPAFRAMERRLTAALHSVAPAVLAPGGGWITNPGVLDALPAGARLVWLRVSPEEAVRRALATGEERPLLAGPDPLGAARSLLSAREPLYAAADLIVDVEGRTPADIVQEITDSLGLGRNGE
jgi:shikimate kinase